MIKKMPGADYVFAWDQELTDQINEEMAESEDVGDFQNPAMNWTGPYTDSSRIGRSMFIDAVDENSNDCTVTITDEEENGKVTRWAINGTFNEEKPAIEYKDAVKSTGTLDEEGNFTEEEKLYENGTGRLEVNENDGTIKWVDDIEDAGNGSIFVFSFEYGGFGTTGEEAAYEEEFSDDELADEDFTEEEEVEDEDLEYDVNEDENSNDTTVDETMEDE